ncbi:hypothetical protein NL676_014557 [Syzygium grande]|nr:hypothetical protein NL676_014557 [Syzygium grande]
MSDLVELNGVEDDLRRHVPNAYIDALPRAAIAHVKHHPLHLNMSTVHRNTADFPISYTGGSALESSSRCRWLYATALGVLLTPSEVD